VKDLAIFSIRLLKKTRILRCAQSPRYNVLAKYASSLACPERKPKDRFIARLASEIFLSSLSSKFFITLLPFLCAGCVGLEKSYPDKRYFVLEAPANPTPSNPSANETLQVSNIRVSPRYADKGFVYRTSEAGYESDFYNQFLVSPASLITEEVRKGLTGSQVFKYVISASNQSQPSYVLEGAVNALYGDFRNPNSPRAVLEMEFFLTSEIPGKPGILMQKRYAKSLPLTGRSPEALIKGWNQALEEILTALVADLQAAALKDSG
jgi:cholesterol transport system auxiliary component